MPVGETLPDVGIPVLVDFLNNVPAPLVAVLVRLAPFISAIRHGAETISWKSSWQDSWLLIAAWWALCLLLVPITRFFLPIVVVGFLLAASRWSRFLPYARALATEHSLKTTIADLIAINSLLPSLPTQSIAVPPPGILLRLLLVAYVPYLILTRLIAVRTLLGIAGTFLLTHRAPWASTLRRVLWSSAHIRWSVYRLYSLLSGTPLPGRAMTSPILEPTLAPAETVKFLFTIYENQRWWVGLDWTAALLPADRPSWCAPPPALQAVAPPNAFALPLPTSVVLGGVRRTACWAWEDSEWRVVVKREAGVAAARVERPLPKEKDKEKEREVGSPFTRKKSRPSLSFVSDDVKGAEQEEIGEAKASEDEQLTDADGWVYGDNKWENPSNKGGIGKYTRYRRWTRVAILYEIIEQLPPADSGSGTAHGEPSAIPQSPSSATQSIFCESPVEAPQACKGGGEEQSVDDKERLRRRLRNALKLDIQS